MQHVASSSCLNFRTALAAVAMLGCTSAHAYVVLGNANPNLAGRAAGYTCCSGDSAPAQSPTEAVGLVFSPGDKLEFTVTGRVSFTPTVPAGNNPDGDSAGSMTNYGDGISAPMFVRFNALYGVFLGGASPTGTVTPSRLNFSSGLDFTDLMPDLGQIFFIGDGLTSDTNAGDFSGTRQSFNVPVGATRLFLGTGDGFGWFNNSGSFDVSINVVPDGTPVPLPPSLALVGLGLVLLATRRRRHAH